MIATNRTIGGWSDDALRFKEELYKFIFEEHSDLLPQDAALPFDKNRMEHTRWWEYCTLLSYIKAENCSVLDVGGLNNVLGWFLAEKYGCEVWQVGISPIDAERFISNKKKLPNHRVYGQEINIENFNVGGFDAVISVSVIEHVAYEKQASSEEGFVKASVRGLKSGGLCCMTFEYDNHGHWKRWNPCSYLKDWKDIQRRIVTPSNLSVVGEIDYNTVFPMDGCCEPGRRPASTGIILLKKEIE